MKNKQLPSRPYWSISAHPIILFIGVGFFLLFANKAISQAPKPLRQFKFDHLTVKDGLSHPVVRCMLQDRQGFLWLATDNGLDRYDGYGFKRYPEKADTTMLTASIRCILESKGGKIWIGSRKGLHVFDPMANKFERLAHISKGKSSNDVFSLLEGKNGLLWVGTLEGLKCYDPKSEKAVELERKEKASFPFDSLRINAMLEDADGHLWIGVRNGGLNRYNPTTGNNQLFTHNPNNEKSLAHNDVACLMRDKYGTLWIGMLNGGMDKYIADNHFQHFRHNINDPNSVSSDRVSFLMEGEGHHVWIGHRGGQLDVFNSGTKSFEQYVHNPDAPSSLGTGSIWWIFQDKSGIIWIAQNGVLSKLDLLKGHFVNHQHQIGNEQSLSHNTVPTVAETINGEIWVGTLGGGLNRFDFAKGIFEQLPFGSPAPEILLEDKIRDLYADRNGGLWIGHLTGKVTYFDGEKFKLYNHNPDDLLEGSGASPIGFATEDDKGNMWWGNIYGVMKIHLNSGAYKLFKTDQDFPKGDLLGTIKGQDGTVWIYGFSGLHRYDPETNIFYPEKLMDKESTVVSAVHEDKNGIMWLGIEKGLLRLDVKNNNYRLYTDKEGLNNTGISCILEDGRDRLWISTEGGLYKFKKNKETFERFNFSDGLSNDAYLINSCCKSKLTGRMYFGGVHGFTEFHPDSIQVNTFSPPIRLSNLHKFNEKNQGEDISLVGKEEINLSFQDQLINIEFAALDFHDPNKNKYQYQLLGQSETWVEIGGKHELTFAKLDPGSHVLKIRGSNNRNIFGKETTLEINIAPPWYKTTAAYLLWFVLSLGLASALYSFLLSRNMARTEAHRLQELASLKSRLYTNITHEFRTPLTVILGMAEQVKNDPKNWLDEGLNLIKRNGKQLLHLVNQLLDLSKLESGNMPLSYVHGDVVAFLKYLSESFHSYADSKDIRLHFLSEIDSLQMDHDPEKLQNILSNLLSNAIKFTPAGGDIYLRINKNEKGLFQLSVQDTGEGINEKDLPHIFDRFYQVDTSSTRRNEGTGIGLSLCRELVRLMGGEINVKSEAGKGSQFIITLPISHIHKTGGSKIKTMEPLTPLAASILPDEPKSMPLEDYIPSDKRPLLLLVEDNPDVVTYLSALLSANYELITATDGQAGIEQAIEHIPDLIVSDVMMPVKDGFMVCAALKTDERTSHIPIILLTAKSDQAAKLEGLTYGADAYLTKPFSKEELLIRIEKLIEIRRQLQASFDQPGKLRQIVQSEAPSPERMFLEKAIQIIEDNLSDEYFGAPELGKKLSMSRSQLFRKLKAITGKSATPFIRSIRLGKAKELLETTDLIISEVGYQTGFGSPAYFSRMFQQEFGLPPSKVRQKRNS